MNSKPPCVVDSLVIERCRPAISAEHKRPCLRVRLLRGGTNFIKMTNLWCAAIHHPMESLFIIALSPKYTSTHWELKLPSLGRRARVSSSICSIKLVVNTRSWQMVYSRIMVWDRGLNWMCYIYACALDVPPLFIKRWMIIILMSGLRRRLFRGRLMRWESSSDLSDVYARAACLLINGENIARKKGASDINISLKVIVLNIKVESVICACSWCRF